MILKTEATVMTLKDLMGNVGEMFTEAIGWVGEVGDTIVNNPLLLFLFLLPVIGIAIGIFKRLTHV